MKKIYIGIAVTIFAAGFFWGKITEIQSLSAKTGEKGQDKYTVENCVNTFTVDRAEKTAKGFRFWYVPKSLSGNLNVKLSNVQKKSANHPPHTHDEAEVFFILKGKAEFNLNGETKMVGKNTTLFCPSGIPHGIRNAGDQPLEYLVIKNN